MKKASFIKNIQKILAERSFDKLEALKDFSVWSALSFQEKELLASAFVLQGEQQLNNSDSCLPDAFTIANQIVPNHPKILFQQAQAFANQKCNIDYQNQANDLLSIVAPLDSISFEMWLLWGKINLRLGLLQKQPVFFHEGTYKFAKAFELIPQNSPPALTQELFYQWGLCWYHLAQESGEAVDYHQAIDKFRQTTDLEKQTVDFLTDYGNALFELYLLIGQAELLDESIELYNKKALLEGNHEIWAKLAIAFQNKYLIQGKDEDFHSSEKFFTKVLAGDENNHSLWFQWGLLLIHAAKEKRRIEFVSTAIEKFKKSDAIQANQPILLTHWAEGMILLGAHYQRLSLLRDAESKMIKSLELLPESADSWYVYGSCLIELGHYFDDEVFYFQALEKFQQGLTLNRSHPFLLYGVAHAYFAIGDLQEDIEMLEKSIRCYAQAAKTFPISQPQIWNDWGIALMKLAQSTQEQQYIFSAVEKFEQAIQKTKEGSTHASVNPEWLYNYGCALDFLGNFDEDAHHYERAIQILSRVISLDPNHANARFNLGLAFFHLGEMTSDIECFYRACENFEKVIAMDSEDDIAWNEWGVTLITLGQIAQDPSHPKLSLQFYEQAEIKLLNALAFGNLQASYHLACLYCLRGNHSATMYYIEKAERQGGLPVLEELLNDDWLEPIRDTAAFRQFISQLTSKYGNEEISSQ